MDIKRSGSQPSGKRGFCLQGRWNRSSADSADKQPGGDFLAQRGAWARAGGHNQFISIQLVGRDEPGSAGG